MRVLVSAPSAYPAAKACTPSSCPLLVTIRRVPNPLLWCVQSLPAGEVQLANTSDNPSALCQLMPPYGGPRL
jgi:hypothetical protein